MSDPTPTPEAVIELMTKCLGAVEQVYSATGRMPYLVDLDNPQTVEQIARTIRRTYLGTTDHQASAIAEELKGGGDDA